MGSRTGQVHHDLTLTLDGVSVACQVTVVKHTPPVWKRTPTTVRAACPDVDFVEDAVAFSTGTLACSTFTDTTDTGLTWLLRTALHDSRDIEYQITHFPDLGPGGAIMESGMARVTDFAYPDYSRGTTSKHEISLTLLTTSGPTRPVV